MKLLDYLALAAALTFTVFSIIPALSFGSDSLEVRVEAEGKEWIYPLDEDRTLDLHGPAGETIVRIEEDSVRVVKSDCKEQICVQTGSINRAGSWIACMPNRVFVSIRGKKTEDLDGETY